MITFVEALYKSSEKIQFGWKQDPVATVKSYNLYVGQVPGTLTLFADGISEQVSQDPSNYKKVIYNVDLADVITLLSLPSTATFDTLSLYWAITYTDPLGSESSLTESTIVLIPPVGITTSKTQKDDPTVNRHIFGFSDGLQKWIKTAASSSGALITANSGLYQDNITTAYTYDSSGNVLTELIYRSDMTGSGSPAKLVSNTYVDNLLTLKVISDSTVS